MTKYDDEGKVLGQEPTVRRVNSPLLAVAAALMLTMAGLLALHFIGGPKWSYSLQKTMATETVTTEGGKTTIGGITITSEGRTIVGKCDTTHLINRENHSCIDNGVEVSGKPNIGYTAKKDYPLLTLSGGRYEVALDKVIFPIKVVYPNGEQALFEEGSFVVIAVSGNFAVTSTMGVDFGSQPVVK